MNFRGWVKDGATKTKNVEKQDFPYTKMKVVLYGVVNLGPYTGTTVDMTLATTGKDRSEGDIFNGKIKKVTHGYKEHKDEGKVHETLVEFDMNQEDSRVSRLVGEEVTLYVE
jgi:hypothetical protein